MTKIESYFWRKLSGLFPFPHWLIRVWTGRVIKDYESRLTNPKEKLK